MLRTFRTEFDQLLGDTFDADSKVSVMAKIEELVLATMKGLITPEIDDSPMGRLKKELVDTVQREVGDVAEEVRRVTEHLGIVDATAEAYEHTTAKGFDYEDLVDEAVGELAAGYGDLAECTANETGSCASKVGDEVVTLNRDDTHGVEARFTLEMKNRPLNMRKTMAELDQALANRDALAAIAVFRSQDQAPTSVPFQYNDDKAIVVLDPDDGDELGTRLAYMWARWTVRRASPPASRRASTSSGSPGCSRTHAARSSGTPRSSGSTRRPRKSIDQAAEQVRDLVGEVREALDELDGELRT